MADDTELNAGSGGDTIATDDIGGVKHQRVKVQHGADGSATDVSTSSPLPVELTDDNNTVVADITTIAGAINAEDAIHGSGDSGIMALAVRNDDLVPLAADGDYTPFQTDEDGAVWVHEKHHKIDSGNSTTTPLAGDAVFTGTAVDLLSFSSVSIQIDSTHDSATDGMTFEFSIDNSNWDKIYVFTYTAADSARVFQLPVHAKWFRIVYTNGSTLQTTFRVQTILMHATPNPTVHRLVDSVDPDRSVTVTKSAIIAQGAGTGDFIPVQATAGGNLKVSVEEADVSASGLAKAEDAPHTSGDTGVAAWAVRNDVLASLVDTDGDYAPFQVNADGAVWNHHAPNEIDSNNSTTATLANDAVYTGTGVEVLDSASVAVTIDSSHDSATDGIQLQFSTDNSNWDVEHLFTYTAANGARIFQLGAHTRYFRLVYTNGGTSQTHFRVQTLLLHSDIITTIHRLVDSTSPDRSATVVKSIIMGQAAGSGNFVPVQTTAAGNFKTSIQEISDGLDIGAGNAGSETQRVSISTDDVNLSALKATISGPDATGPSIDSYTQVAINLTTGADQVLAASAANKQIWVYGYMFTCGDAAGQTVSFQDQDDAALSGIMEFAQYGGASVAPSGNFSMPIWKLGTDKDLEIDITGGDVDGWLTYAVVSV